MSRHNDEIKAILTGKTIAKIEFTGGMSGHCNFIKEIHFEDGTICDFICEFNSDWTATVYGNLGISKERLDETVYPVMRIR